MDFNCPDECGFYSEFDWVGPRLHEQCSVMGNSESRQEESLPCTNKFSLEKGKRKKKMWRRRKSKVCPRTSWAGVIRKPRPYSMPWMVFIDIAGEACAGTLINSQFVLTAAHCFCNGQLSCTRSIGDFGDMPIKIQATNDEIGKNVKIYTGLTHKGGIGLGPMGIIRSKKLPRYVQKYSGRKIFIHPLLGNSKDFFSTPDMALIKLNQNVESFNSHIRPICLANKIVEDRPICPDMSQEERGWDESGCLHKTIFGGCATMAGWGPNQVDRGLTCKTDFSKLGPDKNANCASWWMVNGQERSNCTYEDIPLQDLTEPCYLFARELEFQKAWGKISNTSPFITPYRMKNITQISRIARGPIEVDLSDTTGRKEVVHCGMTTFHRDYWSDNEKNGWCATKLDQDGKIKRWGFCGSACKNTQSALKFSNFNILNNKECDELSKHQDNSENVGWNKEQELCAGKKHEITKSLSYKRIDKDNGERGKEEELARQLGLHMNFIFKPTDYKYKKKKAKSRAIKTPEDYPYDWFLEGVDSCQGDMQGPLWRNIKDKGKIRATQIGVFSRGGCSSFNNPAVFGSVKMSFDWIKQVVEDEMGGKGYCPMKNEWKNIDNMYE